jgi:hypothetical protein
MYGPTSISLSTITLVVDENNKSFNEKFNQQYIGRNGKVLIVQNKIYIIP